MRLAAVYSYWARQTKLLSTPNQIQGIEKAPLYHKLQRGYGGNIVAIIYQMKQSKIQAQSFPVVWPEGTVPTLHSLTKAEINSYLPRKNHQ